MTRIFTALDARAERYAAEASSEARAETRNTEAARIEGILAANPQIGRLCRKGREVFYTTTGGTYAEHTDPAALADFAARKVARDARIGERNAAAAGTTVEEAGGEFPIA